MSCSPAFQLPWKGKSQARSENSEWGWEHWSIGGIGGGVFEFGISSVWQ